MGRAPCCSKVGLHRGPWTPREDTLLTKYIQSHGEGHWRSLPKKAGLLRCGKSCRLRWMNYLRPDIKRGNITPDEDDLIIRLHSLLGNRWSLIAGRLPGRTDNEIKNYWNTHLSKRLRSQGTDPDTHKKISGPVQDSKKRKKGSKPNNKKQKGNNKKQAVPPKNVFETGNYNKPKIHLPKPVRVTSFYIPRNESFECNTSGGSSISHADHHHDGGLLFGTTVSSDVVPIWANDFKGNGDGGVEAVNGVSFFIRSHVDDQDHDDLVNGSDLECQSHLLPPATNNNTLDMLYEEYLQVLLKTEEDQLQLDSFAESLLI